MESLAVAEGNEGERLLAAILRASGEQGIARLAPHQVELRAGVRAGALQELFGTKAACFARAYRETAGRLCEEMLTAASQQQDRGKATRAGLALLLDFSASDPVLARALLVEVNKAGMPASFAQSAVIDRLARAIDDACGGRGDQASTRSRFVVGSIVGNLRRELEASDALNCDQLLREFCDFAALFLPEKEAVPTAPLPSR